MKFPPQSLFKALWAQDFVFKPHLRLVVGAWYCRYLDGDAFPGASPKAAYDACMADYALRRALSQMLALDA
jgi:hypothetical protein